jgi:glycosyltransferase involved in cell wall biosynthesis
LGSPVVGYVVRTFPERGQVFIANEIAALERLGLRIHIYAYHRPQAPATHEVFGRLQAPVSYLPDPVWRHPITVLLASASCAASAPRRYVSTAGYVLAHTLRNRSLHTWLRFFQATCVARGARRSGVQHFHAHFADGTTRIAMLASKLTGLPYSFTTHARDIFRSGVDRALLREKIDGASFVIGVSEYNKRDLEETVRHARNGQVRVVYNGIDLEKFSPDATIVRDGQVLFSAGRFVAKKGLSDLIEACRMLRDRGRTFRCEIAGDGPLRSELEAQVRAAALEDIVTFTGFRSQEQLVDDYRRCAVFVLPAVVAPDQNQDALPTVLLEAIGSGCAVVSTRVAGIPEIIDDGDNGRLVEPGDVAALAGAIDRLLSDPALRARFGESARAKAEARFDVTNNAAELYRSFVNAATLRRTR